MRKIMLSAVVLSLMTLAQAAHAVYLSPSWHVKLTNVGTSTMTPYWGIGVRSDHINVTDDGIGTVTFTIPQACEAPLGESARWGNTALAEGITMGSISFNYQTTWTQPNLLLELRTSSIGQTQDTVVWSTRQTGNRFGNVTIDGNPNGYWFVLTTVPEPSSLLAFGSMCAAGLLANARRRKSGKL